MLAKYVDPRDDLRQKNTVSKFWMNFDQCVPSGLVVVTYRSGVQLHFKFKLKSM